MQIHYALFDQATDTGSGNYWTWADGELSQPLLSRFYNEFAVKHLAPEPNKLGGDIWGGIVHLAAESMEQCGWLILYREFDGGHDRQNRPDRFVILTAWIRADNVYENLVPVFNNETFQYVSTHSRELPVPKPAVLSEETGSAPMRSAFEKFVPFVNPRWDSHLQIESKPSGMDTTESDTFAQELGERFKAERADKDEKLRRADELMRVKEGEWDKREAKLKSEVTYLREGINDKDAEIKNLRKRTTESVWQLLAGGAVIGVFVSLLLTAATLTVLYCSGVCNISISQTEFQIKWNHKTAK
ncbi:MAG: hypothetical protein LBT46_02865 [Planctomycetaceae bacterium]|jgi:hypothetical protein|nr:hypothetical protein [Planctomycetaceae bacterium]